METNRNIDLDTIWGLSWNQAKKYALYFIALNIVTYMCNRLAGSIGDTTQLVMLVNDPSLFSHPELLSAKFNGIFISMLPLLLLGFVVGLLLSAYFNIAIYRLLIDGVRDLKLDITDRLKNAYNGYINYVITVIAASLITLAGYFCCILPGIWLTVRLLFVPIIAANKPEQDLGVTLRESWDMTRGHFWNLFGYGIIAILINIVGFLCCCIGVLFTQVITQFMMANLYCTLSGEFDKEEPEQTEQVAE